VRNVFFGYQPYGSFKNLFVTREDLVERVLREHDEELGLIPKSVTPKSVTPKSTKSIASKGDSMLKRQLTDAEGKKTK